MFANILLAAIALLMLLNVASFLRRGYNEALVFLVLSIALSAGWVVLTDQAVISFSTVLSTVLEYGVYYAIVGAILSAVYWFISVHDYSKRLGAQSEKFERRFSDNNTLREWLTTAQGVTVGNIAEKLGFDQLRTFGFMVYLSDNNFTQFNGQRVSTSSDQLDWSTDAALINYLTPRVREYVGRLFAWAINWPILVIDLIFGRIIWRISTALVELADKLFGNLTQRIVASGYNAKK